MVSARVEADLGHNEKLTSRWHLRLTLVGIRRRLYSRTSRELVCAVLVGTWSMWWSFCSSRQSYGSVVLLQEVSKCVWELLRSLRPPQTVQGPPAHMLQGGERT